uniref:Uncharacterized protein n=1 Tax=Gopherus agassizii TaxID=38772 RepID=A0A452H965_9SAUR
MGLVGPVACPAPSRGHLPSCSQHALLLLGATHPSCSQHALLLLGATHPSCSQHALLLLGATHPSCSQHALLLLGATHPSCSQHALLLLGATHPSCSQHALLLLGATHPSCSQHALLLLGTPQNGGVSGARGRPLRPFLLLASHEWSFSGHFLFVVFCWQHFLLWHHFLFIVVSFPFCCPVLVSHGVTSCLLSCNFPFMALCCYHCGVTSCLWPFVGVSWCHFLFAVVSLSDVLIPVC